MFLNEGQKVRPPIECQKAKVTSNKTGTAKIRAESKAQYTFRGTHWKFVVFFPQLKSLYRRNRHSFIRRNLMKRLDIGVADNRGINRVAGNLGKTEEIEGWTEGYCEFFWNFVVEEKKQM